MRCQTLVVLCCVVLSGADEYENKLTKLWSLSSSNADGSSIVNVTSASIVIQPSSYEGSSRGINYARYAFKPRAIPLKVEQKVEKNTYYSNEDANYKPQKLFPGNYYSISKEKSNLSERQARARFMPMAIPLLRSEEYQRSLTEDDDAEEPIIEKPDGFTEQYASRRSLSDMLGVNDDDDEDEDEELEGEYEVEDLEAGKNKNKRKKTKLKPHKMKKYMLPLLLAYKMKYFALVPVMIGGLVLLVGATGLAGFFFALFAAVMGLQKGGY